MDIFTTMITPYQKNGEVDLATAERYVDFYFEGGLSGIFAICQSSEIFYLSLEERVALNRCVYRRAKELSRCHGRPFTVVSSGHVSDSLDGQARELNAVYESGTDALILITNRLDPQNEGDDTFIRNAEWLISRLPKEARLGLYECPYPYKRLLTPRILKWCLQTGRFAFIKDTCCDVETIRERCEILKGSDLRLFNANCQTLLQSLKDGGSGYCGIMCNYHPKLYVWLCENFEKAPERAEKLQRFLTLSGFTESGLPYPLTAKYHMNLVGNSTVNYARNTDPKRLTPYVRFCVDQMKAASDEWEAELGL